MRRFAAGGNMREVLYEESANPSNLKFQKIIYIVYQIIIYFNIVLGLFFIISGFYISTPILVFGVMCFITVALFMFLKTKIYYCVDCIFVSGSTRIIKVVNYKRRKKLIVFEADEVVQIGRINSESFERVVSTPGIKKVFATPNKYLEEGFYVQVNQNGVNYVVLLECKEDYLKNLVLFTGRKVIEKDYK